MCLIVTLVMLALAIQSFMQQRYKAGTVQLIIALGFMALLIRNILAVRNQKEGCSTTGCGMFDWIINIFKKDQ